MKFNYFDRELPKKHPLQERYDETFDHERGEGLTPEEYQRTYTDFI